ncbi:MAG: T9SS type A sorting domain-containing protein [Chitinophagaceae bacterium]
MRCAIVFLMIFFLGRLACHGQNFTPGNIVVVRIGDGSVSIGNGNAAKVYLDEYSQSGSLVRSLAMPTAVSGSNYRLTIGGNATSDGALTVSPDGTYLAFCGYDANLGEAGGTGVGGIGSGGGVDNSSASIIKRVVGIIPYTATPNTATALADAYDKANIRSAVTEEGTNIWTTGSVYAPSAPTAGVRYTTAGASTSTKLSTDADNIRVAGIANNQLYVTSGAGSYKTINNVGTGLPKNAGQYITNVSGLMSGYQTSPQAFVFFDVDTSIAGPDLLYICDDVNPDDGNQGLNKYSFDGSSWTYRGRFRDECSGVCGYINCLGKVVLFITSGNNANNKIYKYIDNSALTGDLIENNLPLSFAGTQIASAGSQRVFRGIQMAPANGRMITSLDPPGIAPGVYNTIVIKTGANAFLTGDISIAQKLVIESGASLDCGNYIIRSAIGTSSYFDLQSRAKLIIGSANGITTAAASGNIQTCTRRYHSNAIYQYNGTTLQNTGDGLPGTISGSLIVNNSSNIVLNLPVKLTGSLGLTLGKLQTDATNILTITTSTAYSSPANNYGNINQGFENSFIEGPVKYESTGTSEKVLPVGKGSIFAPCAVIPASASPGAYIVEYFSATPPNVFTVDRTAFDHISQLEYWSIAPVPSAGADAKIRLTWRPESRVGSPIQIRDSMAVAHFFDDGSGGPKWDTENVATTVAGFSKIVNGGYGAIETNFLSSSFLPLFTLATKSGDFILPVQLISWQVTPQTNIVSLAWQVIDEEDAATYTIEKSTDGRNFYFLHRYTAKHSYGVAGYQDYDNQPAYAWNYYRLVIVNKQGKTFTYKTEKVWIGSTNQLRVYPNPASLAIKLVLPNANARIIMLDAMGKMVLRANCLNQRNMVLNVAQLPRGVYLLQCYSADKVISQKIILE